MGRLYKGQGRNRLRSVEEQDASGSMRLYLMLPLILCATTAISEARPWATMRGPQIASILTGKTVQYATAKQDFRTSGRTLYSAGAESWGYWVVRDNQYCSMWPPSDIWACYDMTIQAPNIRFIGAAGDVTEGVVLD